MYLFFDTETTGLPKREGAPMTELDNWPRVTELGWQLYDANEKLIEEAADLIYPDGWVMPTGKFWIEHGFSQEKSLAHGIPIAQAFEKFHSAINRCKYLIAHNMVYDYNVLGSELIRYGVKFENRPIKVCTKINQGIFNTWPSLTKLHEHLFLEGFDGAHSALADVAACARCFFELKRIGKLKSIDI
jgi:DNA polymerase III epsilon subunit-like protein